MKKIAMDRRQFVTSAAVAGGWVAAGGLPLLAARAAGNGSGIDANTGPGEVKGMRGYLKTHAPVTGKAPARGPFTLTYDVVHWDWTPGNTDNSVVGTVKIERDPGGKFTVTQDITYGHIRNMIDVKIACGSEPLRPLRKWNVVAHAQDTQGNAIPRLRLEESGRVDGGRILAENAKYHYGFAVSRPVVSQWTMLEYLMGEADAMTDVRFDLLQDLSLFKANQRLIYAGPVDVPMKDGTSVRLRCYRQTGEGVLPMHYLLDDNGLPQLITTMIMSWGLRAVA